MTVIEVGTQMPPRVFGPLTTQMFVRYSGASGDFNPIHFDESFAKASGYPAVFSQGMHHAALLSTFVTDWSHPSAVRRFAVRFADQVWAGDVLTCTGEVTALTEVAGELQATLKLTMKSQRDAIVMTGETDVVVQR